MASERSSRRALVTGATSGIGAAFAERFARDGFDLTLHGRREARLEDAAAKLRSRYGVRANVLVADLAVPAEIKRVEEIVARDDKLSLLVNNAGFTPLAPFEHTTPDELQAMIDVHVVAVTRFTRAALPGMMHRQAGSIINVASDGIFVRYPPSLMAAYAATKAYVDTFTRGIHTVASTSNVRVQVLCPGFVTSEILDRHGIKFEDWGIPASAVMTAETCVAISIAALEMGEVTCVPTLKEVELLDRLHGVSEEIRDQSSGSALPASRYDVDTGRRP